MSNNIDNLGLPFRPVQGTEDRIRNYNGGTALNGYVYFATDTKKIYCGKNGDFIPMGGNSGIYYGTRPLTDDEKYGDDPTLTFTPEQIEGDQIPVIDDLILNLPPDGSSGGFYRVLSSDEDEIMTQKIAVMGSGTGGGGGGSSDSPAQGTIAIKYITPKNSTILSGDSFKVEFEFEAFDSAGDPITEAANAIWKINGQSITQKIYHGYNYLEVSKYLNSSLDNNKISIVVTMDPDTGITVPTSKTWNVKVVDLRLEWPWDYSEDEYRKDSNFTLKWTPYGNIDCTTHIVFDNAYEEGVTYFKYDIPSHLTGKEYTSEPMPSLSYGVHTCEMYITAKINETDLEEMRTPSTFHEITFTRNGSATLLTVPYYEKLATQYDTLNIPFLVYDPDLEKCNVSFYVNDQRVAGGSYDRGLNYWPYTITTYGTVKLTIKSDNNEAIKNIELTVSKLNLPIEEVSGAAFNLKAINFSSNEEIKNWNSNGVTLEFSDNFDWKNGGIKSEVMPDKSIEKYICVRQGTTMTINYELFKNFTTGSTGGKVFKFCFKTANCYDYEAKVLECYDEKSKLGVKFDAQKVNFATPSNPGFASQYYENTYVEIETEIWPNVPDKTIGNGKVFGDRFFMIWVDGVPAGIKSYSTSETLTHSEAKKIVIGSEFCDVYVYVAKAYERKLSENEHLNNFIMDAPSANKMLERYNRNDILDNRGEISYEKLVKNNPKCHAYLYEVDHVTTSKDDKVDGCNYYELFGENNTLDNPYYKATDARTYVQGTSSAAYGVAAFNLRTDFLKKGKIYDKTGKEVIGWKVSKNAIPIDLACTKVNVASCENANNVVNQEWYNKYQPYHDAHRRKLREDGNIYRDTMEFNSGVIFIKDLNSETNYLNDEGKPAIANYLNANTFLDTDKYTEDPYFKQYAIGNMGNDKKNSVVFHDTTNPMACCVEVADNQNEEHWMTVPTNLSQFDLEEPFYEFRYPDGNDKASNEQKQAWVDFVNWMAEVNPKGGNDNNILKAIEVNLTSDTYKKNVYFIVNSDGHYEKATGNFDNSKTYYKIQSVAPAQGETGVSVVFSNYTFKGFDPPGYEGKPNPSEVSLKGTVEKAYSTTKVVSQKKLDENGNPIIVTDPNSPNYGSFVMEDVVSIVPYTNDTYEYRMAKMLSECEDHLVMDSVVYHYLFITRHTMVDNVAKNTFWSTEDGIHWDLTRDYDNDTADGNDNSGNLTYTYGLEFGDRNTDGKDVFNAANSVWINFIHGLSAAQQSLYSALQLKGAWNPKPYLEEFRKHQDVIPERCWIYDYMRKYARPRRLGLDETTYLDRLEGGKKTHQRTQYETYQDFYVNSKYMSGTDFTQSAAIDLRLNKDPDEAWNENNILPITYYINCYGSLLLGGRQEQSVRLTRGTPFNAPVGKMIAAPNDATCYIYGASMIQSLSGLDKLYPGYVKQLGSAAKLRVLELGSSRAGYRNPRLKEVNAGSNAMLQKIQVQNSGHTDFSSLLLNEAHQMKEVLLGGSTLKELSLADGCTAEILELNPLTTLTLSNLTDLETVTVDDGIYNSITNIYIANCPKLDSYTYKFAKQPQLDRYQLNDVAWRVESSDDYTLTDDFSISGTLTNDNYTITGIIALDSLKNKTPKQDLTPATALTGKIIIDVPCKINEYNLYEKYVNTYPNLIIEYGPNVGAGLTRAAELIFLTEQDGNITHYRVLNNKVDTVEKSISAAGPLGVAMEIPYKESSIEYDYTFTGYWVDAATGNKYYNSIDDLVEPDNIATGAKLFKDLVPTQNMTFYPDYDIKKRKYSVKFYDWDGNIIVQQGSGDNAITEWLVEYGSTYNGPMKNYYYRDSSDLSSNERWAFQGWSQYRYGDTEIKNPSYENLETMVVKNTVILYGHFLKEDCTRVPTKNEYFDFRTTTINGTTGYSINIKEEYRNSLQGKITLPAQYNGINVIQIGDFKEAHKITHVFCQTGSQYLAVGQAGNSSTTGFQCTNNPSQLEKVSLSNSITIIGHSAFCDCGNLKDINLSDNIEYIGTCAFSRAIQNSNFNNMQVRIEKLPEKLATIGDYAFYGGGPNITVSQIPNGVRTIPIWSFSYCPNLRIEEFGNSQDSLLSSIKSCAFYDSGISGGTNGNGVTYIVIGAKITSIDKSEMSFSKGFEGYGSKSGGSVVIVNGLEFYGASSLSDIGFNSSIWNQSQGG